MKKMRRFIRILNDIRLSFLEGLFESFFEIVFGGFFLLFYILIESYFSGLDEVYKICISVIMIVILLYLLYLIVSKKRKN